MLRATHESRLQEAVKDARDHAATTHNKEITSLRQQLEALRATLDRDLSDWRDKEAQWLAAEMGLKKDLAAAHQQNQQNTDHLKQVGREK